MSLSDLKKSNKPQTTKKKDFTVDEFIADAENYAKGAPEITQQNDEGELTIEQAIILAKKHIAKSKKQHKPFRHATFTLSELAIEQLQYLSKKSNLAKSHIIRILINELCNEDQRQQLKTLINSKTD